MFKGQFEKFCLLVKTSCSPDENVNETPAKWHGSRSRTAPTAREAT